jgi:hypothetical protein
MVKYVGIYLIEGHLHSPAILWYEYGEVGINQPVSL